MVLEEGQLAPSPLVRMFREHYKPPPTTRSGAESQPLNDFAVLWGLQEAYSAMLLVVNSCRSPSIWQQLRGSCANPLGHQKLYEPVVPHLFFIYWLWKITYIWRGFASAIRSNYHLPQSASEENICCLHTHTHTHTHNSFSNGSFSAASHRVWYALPSHLWQGKNCRCYCIIITIIITPYTTLHTFNGPFSGTTQVSRC